MSDTTRLSLPRIHAGQAQKHVTHNEALGLLDALVHLSVSARHVANPPLSPQDGDRWILAANPAGAFAGKAFHIAVFDEGAWSFLVPRKGWRAYVETEKRLFIFDGTAWAPLAVDLEELQNVRMAGIGTAADAANPFAVCANAALFAARGAGEGGTGDFRFSFNKPQAAATLSQIYQTNWSARAETGLIGDDRFRIKVSADGSSWRDALHVDPATGRVVFPNGASDLLAAAPLTGGTGAAYVLNAPMRGPLPEGALVWLVPHVPNATPLDQSPSLRIEGIDAAPLPLRSFDGGNLAQGALEAGRAVCVRLSGNAYHVQADTGGQGLFNLIEDGGRFAGTPEPAGQTISAFVDPAYFTSLNGATRAAFGIARQNSSTFGGTAAALPPQIAELCTKIRSGSALASGTEFAVLQVTAGAATQGAVVIQNTTFAPPLAFARSFARMQTFGVCFRVMSGSAIVAPESTRVLIDGVPHNHLVDTPARIFNAASGWRHVQHWIAAPGGVNMQGWPLRVTSGTVLLVALPALVSGQCTLPWNIGVLPSSRMWR